MIRQCRFIHTCVWLIALYLFSAPNTFASPTTHPTKRIATSQPTQANTAPTKRTKQAKQVSIQIDKQGVAYYKQNPLSLFQLLQLTNQWKQQKATVVMQIDPSAPYQKVSVVEALITRSTLPLKKQFRALAPKKTTTSTPKAAPVARRAAPTARKTAPAARKARNPHARPAAPAGKPSKGWGGVPHQSQPKKAGVSPIVLRGQLALPQTTQTGALPTALILFKNGKNVPQLRVQTDVLGRFRYTLFPQKGEQFRIAILYKGQFLQYPVPLQQQKNGILPLRIELPAPKTPKKVAAPVAPRTTNTKWDRVPEVKAPKLKATPRTTFQIQIFHKDKSIAKESIPTGLIERVGKKRNYLGRAKTDALGRLRYTINPQAKGVYRVAVLYGTRLHMHTIPPVKTPKRNIYVPIVLPSKVFEAVSFEAFNTLIEPMPKKRGEYRVSHFASVLYQRPPAGQKPKKVSLPIPTDASGVQLGRGMQKYKVARGAGRLQIQNQLTVGRHRLSYAYIVTTKQGSIPLSINIPYASERTDIFIHPDLKLLRPKKPLRNVELSQGPKGPKRSFGVLRQGATKKAFSLQMLLEDSKFKRYSGFFGKIRKLRDTPNGRKKLTGITVLLTTSLLGLIVVFMRPRQEEEDEDEEDDVEEDDDEEDDDEDDEDDEDDDDEDEEDEDDDEKDDKDKNKQS